MKFYDVVFKILTDRDDEFLYVPNVLPSKSLPLSLQQGFPLAEVNYDIFFNDLLDRLVDGANHNEGRVEVFHARQWGTICDKGWDLIDAKVVCRMLGYTDAITTPKYDEGTGRIWLSDVNCQVSDDSIFRCKHAGWGNTGNCTHSNDAGVKCFY